MERPIIYYSLAVYIACFALITSQWNLVLSLLLVLTFFIIILYTQNIKGFILILCFFILGCISFNLYFNINIGNTATFRVVEKNKGIYIGKYKGRKILLKGNFKGMDLGDKITAMGSFYDDKDYSKGIIGSYRMVDYKKEKMDFTKRIYEFKENLYRKYSKVLGEKNAGVVMASCYGDTRYLDYDLKKNLNLLGISHIISVSGFHIALVYKILERIVGIKLGLIGSFIYMLFTGSAAPTVRSFIMILVSKLAKIFYRNYDGLSSISLSALIILIIKPYYVLDIGFTLSYLATLGIIIYNKKIQRILYILPGKINESLSITLSSQVFSMPYVMCTINNVSMFFIPGNLILAPLYSIVVVLGTFGILFSESKLIFRIITSLLYSVMTAIDGGTYLLIKTAPSVVEYNYFYGIMVLSIFMIYIFVKHGYKELRYFPLLLLGFIIIYNMI